jgi:hypothetical protein
VRFTNNSEKIFERRGGSETLPCKSLLIMRQTNQVQPQKTYGICRGDSVLRPFRKINSVVLIGLSYNKNGVGAQYIAPKIQSYYIRPNYRTDQSFLGKGKSLQQQRSHCSRIITKYNHCSSSRENLCSSSSSSYNNSSAACIKAGISSKFLRTPCA